MQDDNFLRQGATFDNFYRLMGEGLFSIDGKNWKNRRNNLNHSFGPLKVRNLFPLIVEKGQQLVDLILDLVEKQGHADVDELFVKATAVFLPLSFSPLFESNILSGRYFFFHFFEGL